MSNTDDNISRELIIRLKNGDMLAFDQIYNHYCHKLFSFILKLLKNESDTEEIVQEVFMKIWESREKLDSHKTLDSYVFTIAYNTSISLIRKKINDVKYLNHLKNSAITNAPPESISELEFNELNDQVQKLIESLPKRQKEIYRLHKETGLSYSEIANQLNISKNTVENHMVKALKFLRQNLDEGFLIHLLFIALFL